MAVAGDGGGGGGGGAGSRVLTLADLNLPNVTKEVRELAPADAALIIEGIFGDVVTTILAGNGFSYTVPDRSAANHMYVEALDRIVLKDRVSQRAFANASTVRKAVITTRVMQLVHQLLRKNIHTSKRDLFYADPNLFTAQEESDAVLNDIACIVGCTRTSLAVVASDKGVVIGRVSFREAGDFIDCTKMGVGGKAIPPYIDQITEIESDAEFILLVEKNAAFTRLSEDRFYNKYPCIMVTGKGQPDVATRLFLRRMRDQLHIPVLGLVDADPYGLKILSVYMSGSKSMSYDSANLTTPDIKWLGVRPSDLEKFSIPEQCRLPMTASDIETGKALLKEEFITKNPAWVAELETMVNTKEKAEIQVLTHFGFQFITEVYLPQKLQAGDWI